MSCGSANENDPGYWSPAPDLGGASLVHDGGAGGAGGSASTGGSGGQTPPPHPTGSVTFQVTPSSYGGRYGPRNVGAIWVENKGGKFVKTLSEWGQYRWNDLVKWTASTNANVVDAVTAATSYSVAQHSGKWNYTDVHGQAVPDGQYQFIVEFSEDDSSFSFVAPGPWTSVSFTNAANQKNFHPPDTQYFHNMTVRFQ